MIEMLNWFELSQIIQVFREYGKCLLIIICQKSNRSSKIFIF